MNDVLFWNLELTIKPGKLDDLRALVADMSARTKAHEPGTLSYEWSVNEDGTECHIYERYTDSGALMAHLGGFQEHFAGRFFDVLDIKRWVLYGNPSDQVRETLAGFGAAFFKPIGGFSR
ncbi:MAG: antibiotic biosynthesis monooxygenase [Saprospiraceae bacterium]|nr:antibiotic biosynthesis monooxygenase [Saprospiraceae bacterium]